MVLPATKGNGLTFTTSYLAMNPETSDPETGSIEVETRRTLDNLKMVIEAAGSSFDKVLKINIFMEDLDEWPAMNEVYKKFFPTDPPARRTVQAKLIEDYKIEIDCIALE